MPRTMQVSRETRLVATEAELLGFANAIRQAGGADVIEALLPSHRSKPTSCLIANALNFGCSVYPSENQYKDSSFKWVMLLPDNLTDNQRAALGRIKGVRLFKDKGKGEYHLTLPKHIGNAAEAFDYGAAFQEYESC